MKRVNPWALQRITETLLEAEARGLWNAKEKTMKELKICIYPLRENWKAKGMTMCEIPPIRMLVLTLTGRCNFKCLYCYASEQDPVDMTEETAIAAVALAHVSKINFFSSFPEENRCCNFL